MKSARPKVVHPLAGRPLIQHILRTVDHLAAQSTVLVVGHGADEVRAAAGDVPGLQVVVQAQQLGTGHALLQTMPVLHRRTGTLLLLYADVPLLEPNTLRLLLERHHETSAAATVLTAELDDPYGYGRIVRDEDGRVARIVEERDASAEERGVREINSGIYCLDLAPLFPALQGLAADNAQGEYYLTDLVALYRQRDLRVETLCLGSADQLRGVNSRVDLADLARVLRDRKNRELMLAGVTLDDPATTYIDVDVSVGPDTVIGPGVQLEGRTSVGARCTIRGACRLTDATLADDVTVLEIGDVQNLPQQQLGAAAIRRARRVREAVTGMRLDGGG